MEQQDQSSISAPPEEVSSEAIMSAAATLGAMRFGADPMIKKEQSDEMEVDGEEPTERTDDDEQRASGSTTSYSQCSDMSHREISHLSWSPQTSFPHRTNIMGRIKQDLMEKVMEDYMAFLENQDAIEPGSDTRLYQCRQCNKECESKSHCAIHLLEEHHDVVLSFMVELQKAVSHPCDMPTDLLKGLAVSFFSQHGRSFS